MGRAAERASKVSKHPRDSRVLAEAMEISDQQQAGGGGIELFQPLQNGHGLSAAQSVLVERTAQTADEVPVAEAPLQATTGLLEEFEDPLLLSAADPDQRGAGSNQQIQLITPLSAGHDSFSRRSAAQRGSRVCSSAASEISRRGTPGPGQCSPQ